MDPARPRPRFDRRDQYVFGYGALAAPEELGGTLETPVDESEEPSIVHLEGYERAWAVAMDNRPRSTGSKYYLDPKTGEQPPVFVTYLDIRARSEVAVNGVLVPVDRTRLERLDRRERNYDRIDVTERIVEETTGTVWAYRGREEARARFERAREEGRAVVNRNYRDTVRRAFEDRGGRIHATYRSTTSEPTVPVRPLRRVIEETEQSR